MVCTNQQTKHITLKYFPSLVPALAKPRHCQPKFLKLFFLTLILFFAYHIASQHIAENQKEKSNKILQDFSLELSSCRRDYDKLLKSYDRVNNQYTKLIKYRKDLDENAQRKGMLDKIKNWIF